MRTRPGFKTSSLTFPPLTFEKSTRHQGDPSLVAVAITNGLRNAVEACLAVAQDQKPKITINCDATDRDYPQEIMNLMRLFEEWCIRQHEDGYLIFRDPADEVVTLEA